MLRIDPRYFHPTEVDQFLGYASKARARLGWAPRTTFAELVTEMMEVDLRNIDKESRFDPSVR